MGRGGWGLGGGRVGWPTLLMACCWLLVRESQQHVAPGCRTVLCTAAKRALYPPSQSQERGSSLLQLSTGCCHRWRRVALLLKAGLPAGTKILTWGQPYEYEASGGPPHAEPHTAWVLVLASPSRSALSKA